jgi:hypothetical protein
MITSLYHFISKIFLFGLFSAAFLVALAGIGNPGADFMPFFVMLLFAVAGILTITLIPYLTIKKSNLYVAESGEHKIRKIVIDNGTVTTLAGTGSQGNEDTAPGTSARFYRLQAITTDGTNLYVAEFGNHRIRKIVIDNGTVTTLAGSSSGSTDTADGTPSFKKPRGITTDGTNLYVADDNHRIRKIVISTGVVTTIAGNSSGLNDATGTAALFDKPFGITTDGTNLYVADWDNHRIRKIE